MTPPPLSLSSSSTSTKPETRRAAAAATPNIHSKHNETIAAYLDKVQNVKEQIESIIAETEALEIEQQRRYRNRKLLGNNDASSEERQKQIHMVSHSLYCSYYRIARKILTYSSLQLENRLNDALVKFNTKVQCNKTLRGLIGEKRRDRCLFDEIYTALEREIHHQSNQMSRELERGKKTLELRNKAEKELAIAKKQLQENKAALELDQNELNILREQLKEEGLETEESPCRQKTTPASSRSRRRSSVAPLTAENDKCNDDIQDDIYEEKKLDALLEQVMQLTGNQNVDTLIGKLAENDERNFSRFQYITELEAEVGRVEDDIINATRELERMKSSGMSHRMQQLNERELAKQKQQMLIDKEQALDKQYESQVELWEKMRTGIAHVHCELGLTM